MPPARDAPRAVALQMDPIQSISPAGDTSFVLGLEAQRRGWDVWHYLPGDLSLQDGRLTALARRARLHDGAPDGAHATLEPDAVVDLSTLDVILMRQDPPFDVAYITATHLLEHVHPRVRVVNDPAGVRNAPEKLLVTRFPDLMPPTLITRRADDIAAFRRAHGEIVIKPLHGNGGAGVFHLRADDPNLPVVLETLLAADRAPLMAQPFLPAVRAGDRRVILINGEPAGVINRVPPPGQTRSNMHAGGRAEKATLTKADRDICAAIGPTLKERGLLLAGIDVIGDRLTEINVTSPTGLREINRFDGVRLEAQVWDAIEDIL